MPSGSLFFPPPQRQRPAPIGGVQDPSHTSQGEEGSCPAPGWGVEGLGGGGLGTKTTVPSPRCAATRRGAEEGRPPLGGGAWEGGGVRSVGELSQANETAG